MHQHNERLLRIRRLLGLLFLTAAMAGCGAAKNPPHPNQIDKFDGKTYDVLTTAQATLDQAKTEFKAGQLPASSNVLIDKTGAAYNDLRDAWIGYRAFKSAGKDATDYVTRINSLIPLLNQFIADLKILLGKKAEELPIMHTEIRAYVGGL